MQDLEKMQKEQDEAMQKRMADKQKLLGVQWEDQRNKNDFRETHKKLSSSVHWENSNVLSYVFQEKEHKAMKYNRRNENIFNYYSGKLHADKQQLLAKE